MFRKVLFWMHLIAGCVAGVIILIMSATGVALTYERQMLARADRGNYRISPPPAGVQRLNVDELIARVQGQGSGIPRNASVVVRADSTEPVEISAGRGGGFYVNPYDGQVLGRGDQSMHQTFQKITAWHRWLGTEGEGRQTAKAITGACNFAFLFIVASGMYLWLPKLWSMRHLRPITWFKGGLGGKARDFNWHNVFGIWTSVPLLVIVASGLPMSYQWANNLLYRMTGSEIPRQAGPGGPGGRGGEGRGGREGGGGREGRPRPTQTTAAPVRELSPLLASIASQAHGWNSISMRLPERASDDIAFTVDRGDGGQPQKRSTITVDGRTGAVRKTETFADASAGRRLRTWSRFAHTGEYYGIVGQTIAGIASFAGVMLVWTGISLALRRLAGWRARQVRKQQTAEPEPALR